MVSDTPADSMGSTTGSTEVYHVGSKDSPEWQAAPATDSSASAPQLGAPLRNAPTETAEQNSPQNSVSWDSRFLPYLRHGEAAFGYDGFEPALTKVASQLPVDEAQPDKYCRTASSPSLPIWS